MDKIKEAWASARRPGSISRMLWDVVILSLPLALFAYLGLMYLGPIPMFYAGCGIWLSACIAMAGLLISMRVEGKHLLFLTDVMKQQTMRSEGVHEKARQAWREVLEERAKIAAIGTLLEKTGARPGTYTIELTIGGDSPGSEGEEEEESDEGLDIPPEIATRH